MYKRRLFAVLILLFSINLYSQILQWTPEFATRYDQITITYDPAQGNGALAGVFPIYIHTGVITNLSTTPTDWRYVKTVWNNNITGQVPMTFVNNKWQFTIDIPNYYQVPESEEILQLAFVFRNADGSKVGREADGSDIFLPLSQPGLNVSITIPNNTPTFLELNSSLNIEVSSQASDSLILYINNEKVLAIDSTNLVYQFAATYYGKSRIKAIAKNDTGMVVDSTYIMVNPPVQTASLPNGIKDGINYIDDNSVIFSLYAPQKQNVYVIGDFTNWEVDIPYYMKLTPDSLRWWIEVDGLQPHKEYIFQYLVDQTLRIADPYSEKVSDPWNDKWISSSTYPNLIEYPFDKTSQIASVIELGQQPYQWNINNFQKPRKEDLVIYELLLRDFLTTHDYKTLIDTLNYLKQLGVNAIELMPVMEFEGNESWGYNPAFHLAPDKYYGPKDDLKRFIDTAHSIGFAVILDMVLNHAFGSSPLVRLYWDAVNNRPAANSPWFNPIAKHPFNVGYDFNHESLATQYYVDRVNEFWIKEYKFDGFRFDLSKGFTQRNSGSDVNYWGQYDPGRIVILKRMADKIWDVDTSTYVILEHFAVDQEEIELSNYGMMLWGNLNSNYNEATMGWISNSNFSRISYKARGWSNPYLVGYMESHDEERLMYKNLQYGNSSGNYNIKNLSTALDRIKLAGAFFFTVPGPKMIWQFGELGYDISIEYDCRVCNKPIKWEYYSDPLRNKLYKVFSYLIYLKKNYDVFRTTDFSLDVGGATKKIQLNHSSMKVNILGNFDVATQNMNPTFQQSGWWYDAFTGDSMYVNNVSDSISLNPGEFHIYSTVKLPSYDIITDVKDSEIVEIPTQFYLSQNYPNPFNPTTKIRYTIPFNGNVNYNVSLKIYNIMGQEIATLVDEIKSPGEYEVEFNGKGLSSGMSAKGGYASGVYFYELRVGNFVEVKKMILMK